MRSVFICTWLLVWGAAVQTHAGDRTPYPAKVNAEVRHPARPLISLDGEWEFATDARGIGEVQRWYAVDAAWRNARSIRVPGCWEAQGVGGPGESNPTTPEAARRRLRGSYVGAAWYRKRVAVPADWKNRLVWLKVGGVNSQGWFWINGEFVAHVDSYCGSYRYDISEVVEPGREAVVVALVRNDVPSRKGVFNWMHRFGGLYRGVELEATGDPFIESVYTVADATRGGVVWCARVRSLRRAGAGSLRFAADFDAQPAGRAEGALRLASGQALDVSAAMPLAPLRYWSPESPHLYAGTAELIVDGSIADGLPLRFGVKTWEVRNGDFYLNGRPYYLRGYGDDFVYPLTLSSPASKMFHVKHFEIAKGFGLNYVRLHTHCELPEYFEAADEVGMMVQPELPYYGARPSAGSREYFLPEADLRELIDHYRDHVSLATYCTGNEGWLGSPTDEHVFRLGKQVDPTRLFLHQDGGVNRPNNSDYDTIFEWDARLRSATFAPARPLVLHEYLNLALDEDPRRHARYTGALLPAGTMDDFKAETARRRLDSEWGLRCFDAGYRMQSYCQKEGLEKARRDPRLDGQIFWTIVDVGAPYSSQGLLDQFWEAKHSTPQFFRRFNAPTVVLAELPRDPPIFTSGERIDVRWMLSHYEATEATRAHLAWMLGRGRSVGFGAGSPPSFTLQAGVGEVARTRCTVPVVGRSEILTLYGRVETEDATPPCVWENAWDVWVFPATRETLRSGEGIAAGDELFARLSPRLPGLRRAGDTGAGDARLLLSERFGARERAWLNDGRDVLLLSMRGWPAVRPGARPGWWTVRGQAGTAVASHPALGDFPHQGWLSPVFFSLVDRAVKREGEFINTEPMILGHGRYGYLLYAFQARAAAGRLLANGLDLLSGRVEADDLLRRLIDYALSPEFAPQATLELAELPDTELLNGCARIHADSVWEQSYDSFLGLGRLCFVRAGDGRQRLRWETDPIPEDAADGVSLRMVAGMGYASQPAATFTLALDGAPLLDFGVTLADATWYNHDRSAALFYDVKQNDREDSSGFLILNLTSTYLTPGKALQLEIRPAGVGSRQWFGLYDF
ncbi:hypothetical protein HS125_04945 [bacterium]|nr:hypothetical protein [bacterium]